MVETILIAAAVIPALILLVRIYRLDRLESEPVSLAGSRRFVHGAGLAF